MRTRPSWPRCWIGASGSAWCSPATPTACARGSTCSPRASPRSRTPRPRRSSPPWSPTTPATCCCSAARARADGVDPDAYVAPDEGEAIYRRLDELSDVDELLGYAVGSLDHFDQLLSVYRAAADGEDADAIDSVRGDVARALDQLRPMVDTDADAERLAAEAHELYRRRELVETPRYVHAG